MIYETSQRPCKEYRQDSVQDERQRDLNNHAYCVAERTFVIRTVRDRVNNNAITVQLQSANDGKEIDSFWYIIVYQPNIAEREFSSF